ncbi:MAG: HD domain-containing protein [Lachnospiraceae bacterium]|nr:HD domain-containing protein [Lachnospiraceae bacterium]MBO4825398.1 HD domain-containing protein [Lachnospiraceae bacterium]MBR5992608.1 HD domain-containing protein [Lachnospiraceae bacterium]
MKYIQEFREGDHVAGIYLCKQKNSAVTKNGKPYDNVILQDKTGSIDCKIWDVGSAGICDFDALDYVDIVGEVSSFNGALQVSIKRTRVAGEGEYDPRDYLPVSERDIDEMYKELLGYVGDISNHYLKALLDEFFVKDEAFIKRFKQASAAKSVHHCFVGGLLEHTVSVANLCRYYAAKYPMLKKDLVVSAALLHDIGKVYEISSFPENDYTDEGNLLGHIVMGAEMVGEKAALIDGFPKSLLNELKHCILAHHGKLEFGSPKKPALIEAVALNFADDLDAKMETFKEILGATTEQGWLGFNRLFESNLRATKQEE